MDPQDMHSSEGRIDPTIGERVMLIRRRRGISQRDLAARAQMSPTALNRLERGLQSVWAERLATLARLLDVSADYLLGLHDNAHVAPRTAAPRPEAQEQPPPAPRPRRRTPAPVG
jgi:transcriptional regulator with XRE-family HTH domain